MSDLVGNPEDRFSHVAAQVVVVYLCICKALAAVHLKPAPAIFFLIMQT